MGCSKSSSNKDVLAINFYIKKKVRSKINNLRDFLGGAVVKNLPANARDTGLSPCPGRSHVPKSN